MGAKERSRARATNEFVRSKKSVITVQRHIHVLLFTSAGLLSEYIVALHKNPLGILCEVILTESYRKHYNTTKKNLK